MLLSIRQSIIIFTVFIILITSGFILNIRATFEQNQKSIETSQRIAAANELKEAISLTLENIKVTAIKLSQWQEVNQQLKNPEIFSYWYSVRFKSYASELQKNAQDLMVYNEKGYALSKLDDNTLPYIIDVTNINSYTFDITPSSELVYINPIYNEENPGTIIGFFSARLDFLPGLRNMIHYQYVDPESLKIDTQNTVILKNTLLPEHFSYDLHTSEQLKILGKQIIDTSFQLIAFIIIPILFVFFLIIFFIGHSIQDVVLYINRLSQSAEPPNPASQNKHIIIKELKDICDSLNNYHINLRRNEEHLSLTLNSIDEAVITTDEKFAIIRMNPVAEQLTGWTHLEASGYTFFEIINLVDPYSREPLKQVFSNVINKGESIDIKHDTLLISKDGSEYYITPSAAPITDSHGHHHGMVFVLNDITEQKIKDEQLQQSLKMDALGKLTGGIAHDFNNMLGIILGYSDLLKLMLDKDTPPYQYIDEIARAGGRARDLTAKLLTFSSKGSHQKSVSDINTLIRSERDMLSKTLTVRIELILNMGENLWPVLLDTGLLQDAILNICINAMHAMPDGGKLTITTRNAHFSKLDQPHIDLEEGDYVMISLTDTGCGMDKATRQKIFDPFFTTKGEQGTGLGLSQVYGFIMQSGGSIHVYSEPGIGTKFTLYLPRFLDLSSAPSESLSDTTASQISLRGTETILVVDDESALTILSCSILEKHGYRTLSASSAHEALTLLQNNTIDLLLSDVIMPKMGGYELAQIVMEQYPSVKIQLISGFTDEPSSTLRESELFQRLLNKPYSAAELLTAIRQLLDS